MTVPVFDEFERLSAAVLDGTASRGEVRRFNEILRDFPELAPVYLEQVQMHAMLECRGAGASGCGRCGRAFSRAEPAAGIPAEKSKSALSAPAPLSEGLRAPFEKHSTMPGNTQGAHVRVFWRKVAAAAAVLLSGAGGWYGVMRPLTPVSRLPSPVVNSPVTMVEWKGAWGLELPRELPGRIRLAKGQAKVRLPSGVELVLLGPVELDAENGGMEARLVSGRLMAWVPPRAGGFTVRAPWLTAWDIGTVFSVAADAEGSSLFVFKGSVQALDGEGNGVDICGEGEGVLAMAGRAPFKVETEEGAGDRLFKAVRGYAALAEPQKALDAARQIGELWMAKYVPEEAGRARETARRQAVLRNAPRPIPFTKTAWVRPSVPLQQEETSEMNTTRAAAMLAAAVMTAAEMASARSGSVPVSTSPVDGRRWETVYSNEVDVALRWDAYPANAAYAELRIDGMSGTALATNITRSVSNVLWRAFAAQSPAVEDVFDVRLTLFDSGDAVVGAQTSRLALVKGAFGSARVDPDPAGGAWNRVRENVPVPYDAGWTEATAGAAESRLVIAKAGGMVRTNALEAPAGYYGWKIKQSDWGYGTFNLALTFPGTVTNEWDAMLVRVPEGFMFSVR
ncbi:MAG: FecR family protein [Kiritimatiellae bacterium]|nr:FecR family protein [Kiritimatiellia bacterium]